MALKGGIVDQDVAVVQIPGHIWLADVLHWNVVNPVSADLHWIDSTNCEALIKRVDMNIVAVDQQATADACAVLTRKEVL